MIKESRTNLALEAIQHLVINTRKSAYDKGANDIGDSLDDIDYALGLILQENDCSKEFEELIMSFKEQGVEVPSQIYLRCQHQTRKSRGSG